MHKNKTKEPLFHIAKRAALPWYLSWAIRIGAIVLALVACAALTVFLTHENPFQVYATMFRGAFSTPAGYGTCCKVWLCCCACPWR